MSPDFKRFLKSLFFLLPMVLAFVYIELTLSDLDNSYKRKMRLIQDYGLIANVVVLGNSHALHGINPVYF
jgi:hypothetical protein